LKKIYHRSKLVVIGTRLVILRINKIAKMHEKLFDSSERLRNRLTSAPHRFIRGPTEHASLSWTNSDGLEEVN